MKKINRGIRILGELRELGGLGAIETILTIDTIGIIVAKRIGGTEIILVY